MRLTFPKRRRLHPLEQAATHARCMRERVRNTTALRRITYSAVLAPLLLALLLQSLAPHAHELACGAASFESAATGSLPAPLIVEPGGCVACRAGSARLGIAAGAISLLFRVSEPEHLLPRELTPTPVSRLVRAAAPPRAPPV